MRTAPGGGTGRRIQPAADRRGAEDFALKIEHGKRARVFIYSAAGDVLVRACAGRLPAFHVQRAVRVSSGATRLAEAGSTGRAPGG